jgi:type VI secretion system protein
MASHSLLRRIRHPEYSAPRRVVSDDEVRASILENLKAICTTRVGSALACPDYGIVSVTDIVHSCPDAIGLILESVRHSIRAYEPRLMNAVVIYVPPGEVRDLTIRFDIAGQLVNGGRKVAVKFQTVIDATRNVRVE